MKKRITATWHISDISDPLTDQQMSEQGIDEYTEIIKEESKIYSMDMRGFLMFKKTRYRWDHEKRRIYTEVWHS